MRKTAYRLIGLLGVTMEDIGFIGLGRMGSVIAERIDSVYGVKACYNRTASKIPEKLKIRSVLSPEEVMEKSDIVFMILSNSEASWDVLQSMVKYGKGKSIIDMSTISYEQSLKNHEFSVKNNCAYMDAPVIGSVPAAVSGKLTVVCGGNETLFNRVRSIFETFTVGQIYCGKAGNGIGTKLVNNLVMGINMLGASEGLSLGRTLGLKDEITISALMSGGAASRILDLKKDKLVKGNYSTEFSLDHQLKDLEYAVKLQRDLGVPDFLSSMANSIFLLEKAEHGSDDMSSVIEYYRKKRINDQ